MRTSLCEEAAAEGVPRRVIWSSASILPKLVQQQLGNRAAAQAPHIAASDPMLLSIAWASVPAPPLRLMWTHPALPEGEDSPQDESAAGRAGEN